MIHNNMDFAYTTFAFLLIFMHGCIGQDNGDDSLSFEVSISPNRPLLTENLGTSVALTCEVVFSNSGSPAAKPVYRWEFEGKAIIKAEETERVYTEVRPNSFMLRLDDIKDSDSGDYKCVATHQGQEDSRTIRLEIVKPLTVKSPSNQHGVKGTDGEVMCDVSAKPSPTISWKFANGTFIENTDKYIIQSDRLIVKNLEFSDDGNYLCDIVVTQTGKSKVLNITYLVVELPDITLVPTIEPNNPTVGKEVKIHCTASGVPKPTYSFKKDGNTVPDNLVDAVQGILTIESLQRSDEASYTCIATNPGGVDEESNLLDVKIPPIIKELQDVGDAVEDGVQEIVCEAEGDPAPTVAWRKKGMETDYSETDDHPKITVIDNDDDNAEIKVVRSTMTFDPVQAQDAGDYVCTATNIVGDVTDEVKMAVQYKPHFDVDYQEDTFYGWNGHQTNITCQASANGLASITWKRKSTADPTNEETIKAEGPFTITDLLTEPAKHLSTRSLLVFINDDQSLYGEYICEASNARGDEKRTVTLREATPPQQPEVSVTKTLSTMATLSVNKPDGNGGQPIKSYSYTYNIDGEPSSEDMTQDLDGDMTSITLKGLSPSSSYVINLSAVNAVGPGTATVLTFETLKVSKPQKMVITSEQIGQESTSYKLKWAEPDDGGSPITKFLVKYKQVTVEGTKPEQWIVSADVDTEFKVKEAGSNARSYELKELKRDAHYEVVITATNDKGTSDPERSIIKTIKGNVTDEEEDKDEGKGDGETATESPSKGSPASAGMESGIVIAIIVVIILVLLIIVLVVYFVTKKRRAAGKGDVEGGKADDGKEAAEEEKLIQKDNPKTENESDKKEDGIEETPQYEPGEKPTPPTDPTETADDKAKDGSQTEPTIEITPETPEKPENPSA